MMPDESFELQLAYLQSGRPFQETNPPVEPSRSSS